MATITQETHVELSKRESLALGRLRGHTLRCLSGEIWLTAEGEGCDVVLGPGQTWTTESTGPVVVSAFMPSALSLSRPRRAIAPTRRRGVFARLLDSLPPLSFPAPITQ